MPDFQPRPPVFARLLRSRRLPYGIAAIAVASLGLVALRFWFEMKERFPRLEAGAYIGRIEGALGEEEGAAHLYVESQKSGDEYLFLVLEEGFEPERVAPVVRGVDRSDTESVLPVTVSGSRGQLKFIGEREGGGLYGGAVYDIDGGTEGRWTLERLAEGSGDRTADQETKLWLALTAELSAIEERIEAARSAIPEHKAEIEKLDRFISEGEELRKNAEKKYADEKGRLATVDADLVKARAERTKAKEQYDLALRLTKVGKLVALGRDSLDREGRWAEAVLRGGGDLSLSPDDEALMKKGERVAKLRKDIEGERRKIDSLLDMTSAFAPEGGAESGAAPSSPDARAPHISPQELP